MPSPCPTCGDIAARTVYDLGFGPEVCCLNCGGCWPPDGTPARPQPHVAGVVYR